MHWKGQVSALTNSPKILHILYWNISVIYDIPIVPVSIMLVPNADYCPPQNNICKITLFTELYILRDESETTFKMTSFTVLFIPPRRTTILTRQSTFVILCNGCIRSCFVNKSWNWSKSSSDSCITWIRAVVTSTHDLKIMARSFVLPLTWEIFYLTTICWNPSTQGTYVRPRAEVKQMIEP